MVKHSKTLLTRAGITAFAVAALAVAPIASATAAPAAPSTAISASDINEAAGTFSTAPEVSIQGAADGTPAGAIQWYKNHMGSTAWQGLCEKAVENAYGVTGVWASANAHWNGAPHHSGAAPLGAFVYWNISAYGHVGISDGNGGFYATSVGGKIGHATSVNYFNNYRGWTPAAVPSR